MKTRIQIVEDERITAEDIKQTLESFGYVVTSIVSDGETAIKNAVKDKPSLILMDIVLKGSLTGIDVARKLKEKYNIPIVYLTAYSDEETLKSAKLTEPYGYILKPFEERELYSNIEMALFKNEMENKLLHINSILKAIREINHVIVVEKEIETLIKRTVDILIEPDDYFAAMIIGIDNSDIIRVNEFSFKEKLFDRVITDLKNNNLPKFVKIAFESDEIQIFPGIIQTDDLTLGIVLKKIKISNEITGVLGIYTKDSFLYDRESLGLFEEIVNDINFAFKDIEHRKERAQIEKAIFDQKKFLESVLNSLTHPFMVIDPNDKSIILANNAAKGEDTIVGAKCFSVSHNYDDPCYNHGELCPMQEVLKTGKPFSLEHIHWDSNRQKRIVEVNMYPIFDENNNIISLIEYNYDITEKKSLQVSFSNFIEQSNEAIFILENNHLKLVNKRMVEIFGYDKELLETDKFNIMLLISPKNRGFIKTLLEREREGKFIYEFTGLNSVGNEIECEVSVSRIADRDGLITLGIIRDITEKKDFIKRLEESEERFRSLYENATVGIYRTTPDGQVILANPELIKMLGYKKIEDITKRKVEDMFFNKDDRNEFKNIIENEGVIYGYEVKWEKADGSLILVQESAKCIRDSDGNVLFYEGVVEDITERKRMEEELIKAKEQAEKMDRLKSEFLAQVSHEIRTPINAIISFADLIKSEVEGRIEDDLLKSFSIIDSSGRRITRTVDLILNMSQLQTGTYNYTPAKFDVYLFVLRKLILEYQTQSDKKHLTVNLIKNTDDCEIFAEEYSVYHIMKNLIENAIKYTNEGKIDIVITVDENNNLVVSVSDTGIGISKEFMPKLFDPFTQEDEGYSRKYEGNGLGLALVKRFCQLNNAEIKVDSEKGKGSVFTVIFQKNK